MAIFVTKWIHAKPSSVPVNLCQKGRATNFSCPTEFRKVCKTFTALQTSGSFCGLDSLTLGNAY